jgi:PPP family 3-phenylpropionic acid transporter
MFSNFMLSMGFFSASTLLWIALFYFIFSFFNSASGPLSETLCISYAQQNNIEFGRIRLWGEVGIGTSAFAFGFIVQYIGISYSSLIYLIAISLAIIAGFGIPHRMNDSMFSIYLNQLGGTESQLGFAWLLATISTVPALIYVGRLIQRWNELGIFFIAAFIYSIRWIIYSLVDSPSILIAFQLLNSVSFPLFLVACVQYMVHLVPPELRATGLAAFAVTFGGLGGIIGNAGGGYMIEHYGSHVAYAIGGILAMIGALAAIGTNMYNTRKSNQLSLKSLMK